MSRTSFVALVGNPNCGKSALFNALTGLRQKVANYPGATVERRSGAMNGRAATELIDLPGTYSLTPRSLDETVTRDVLTGQHAIDRRPDAIICVVDATNLAQHLRFAIELRTLGIPMVLALNMLDLAEREKITIDSGLLSEKLGIPVVETVAVRRRGLDELKEKVAAILVNASLPPRDFGDTVKLRQRVATKIAKDVTLSEGVGHKTTQRLDSLLLHPVAGMLILLTLFFVMFQAVFSWAGPPADMLEHGVAMLQSFFAATLSDGWLRSLLNDGLLAGVGAVVVFLPQIILLFLFILILESTGYMARAAFLMDRLMSVAGLSGRAFIPLLSSFACAVPGIMSARSVTHERDRLTTILIAPLMTCSARWPVYTLIISAFIPDVEVAGGIGLQGLVFWGLFLFGAGSAILVAAILKRTVTKGTRDTFMMELPKYQAPNLRFVLIGLLEKARVFLRRAGTIILASTVTLWALAQWPSMPDGAEGPAINHSLVGMIGRALEVVFAPIGFNWEISVALVPGMAAREVAVSALGTVYALQGSEEMIEAGLVATLNGLWSLPTALSFLMWFVFAPQCLSTIAVTRRETGGWRWPLFMIGYLFGLAYSMSFITFQLSSLLIG